jgi:hypothetical protein
LTPTDRWHLKRASVQSCSGTPAEVVAALSKFASQAISPERREQPRGMCVEIDNREIHIMAKLNTIARNKLPAKDFAEPKKRAYPVEDKAHARNAKARASQAVKAGRMSNAEEGKIDKKANAVLKKG